jgi:hypothetical protein
MDTDTVKDPDLELPASDEPVTKEPGPVPADVPDLTVGAKKSFWSKYKVPIAIGVLLALCIIIAGVIYYTFINPPDKRGIVFPTPTPTAAATTSPVPSGLTVTGTITATATVTPSVTVSVTPTPGFQVTAVSATVDNALVNSCTNRFNYSGQITANAAGAVTYQWQRSDGMLEPAVTLTFTGAGTKPVTETWDVGCSSTCSYWMKLLVTAPNAMQSTQVNNTLTCSATDFGGDWYHNFGTAHLDQTGAAVTGTYQNRVNTPAANGTLNGTVSGSSLSGSWNIGGGSGSLMWVRSGSSFTGNWNGSYTWCGARAGSQFPANCSFSGDWKIKVIESLTDICPGGNMDLNVTISSGGVYNVSGTYCGTGTVTGAITFADGTAVLNGTWSNGGTGSIKFWLEDAYNAMQFRGHYYNSDGTIENSWCGWRSSSSQPATCLR